MGADLRFFSLGTVKDFYNDLIIIQNIYAPLQIHFNIYFRNVCHNYLLEIII